MSNDDEKGQKIKTIEDLPLTDTSSDAKCSNINVGDNSTCSIDIDDRITTIDENYTADKEEILCDGRLTVGHDVDNEEEPFLSQQLETKSKEFVSVEIEDQ